MYGNDDSQKLVLVYVTQAWYCYPRRQGEIRRYHLTSATLEWQQLHVSSVMFQLQNLLFFTTKRVSWDLRVQQANKSWNFILVFTPDSITVVMRFCALKMGHEIGARWAQSTPFHAMHQET